MERDSCNLQCELVTECMSGQKILDNVDIEDNSMLTLSKQCCSFRREGKKKVKPGAAIEKENSNRVFVSDRQ